MTSISPTHLEYLAPITDLTFEAVSVPWCMRIDVSVNEVVVLRN